MGIDSWRGSFAIPMTPYEEDGRIDERVLTEEIEFCIKSGVGGLATPLMVSEFRNLSEQERKLMIRLPVEISAGRVPVVANCAAVNVPLAVEYAAFAQKAGADAVIAMPPYIHKTDFPSLFEYYKAISDVVTIPVWIQNAGVSPLSPNQISRLCEEIEHVSWVKEEVAPSTHSISALMSLSSRHIAGVMGGGGGRYMITEHARGSAGVIHACQFCDVVQRIWEHLDGGATEEAAELYEHLLPALMLEGLMGMAFAKEIMVRRGIFRNHTIRGRAKPLDEFDFVEIDRIWERIQPHLLWQRA